MEEFGEATGSDWSPAGDLVAVGGTGKIVRVWEEARGLETLELSGAGNNIVAFHPDGQSILTVAGQSNEIKVFDLSEAYVRILIPTGWASFGGWSPTGDMVAAGFEDGTIKVWDSASGEERLVFSGHNDTVLVVVWSPSGDRILTTSYDLTVKIWDTTTGEHQMTQIGHDDMVINADWSPGGKWISTPGYDGKVLVWSSTTGEVILTFTEHHDWVNWAVWSPDGTRILSAGANGEAMIWDAFSGEVLLDLYSEDYDLELTAAAWIMDGERVVLKDAEGIVRILDSGTGEELFRFATPGYGYNISFSPSEERVLIGNGDGSAMVWNIDTGKEMLNYEVGGWVETAYSPDGSRVLISNTMGKLQIFPTWQTTKELIDYAYKCCVFRQLTAEERQLFGLPQR